MLSCLFILGTKKRMLYCLLMFGGPKCENHVRGFAGSFSFFNMQRTAHRHPQVCWNHYCIADRRFGSWPMDFITELPLCANGCNAIFTCVDCLTVLSILYVENSFMAPAL